MVFYRRQLGIISDFRTEGSVIETSGRLAWGLHHRLKYQRSEGDMGRACNCPNREHSFIHSFHKYLLSIHRQSG